MLQACAGPVGKLRQRFFHSFEACSLALPVEPDLSFISLLLIKQDELAHLPLLGQTLGSAAVLDVDPRLYTKSTCLNSVDPTGDLCE